MPDLQNWQMTLQWQSNEEPTPVPPEGERPPLAVSLPKLAFSNELIAMLLDEMIDTSFPFQFELIHFLTSATRFEHSLFSRSQVAICHFLPTTALTSRDSSVECFDPLRKRLGRTKTLARLRRNAVLKVQACIIYLDIFWRFTCFASQFFLK